MATVMDAQSSPFVVAKETVKEGFGSRMGSQILSYGAACREAGVLLNTLSPVREDFLGEGS